MLRLAPAVASCALVLSAGCAPRLPPVVPVEGTVTVNGKPLPRAVVTFMPLLDHFGAETVSVGTTDEKGHFTLTCQVNGLPGAVTGTHVVTVFDPPLPENLRNVQDYRVVERHRAALGNRPIPTDYTSTSRSPLRVEVAAATPPVSLELTR